MEVPFIDKFEFKFNYSLVLDRKRLSIAHPWGFAVAQTGAPVMVPVEAFDAGGYLLATTGAVLSVPGLVERAGDHVAAPTLAQILVPHLLAGAGSSLATGLTPTSFVVEDEWQLATDILLAPALAGLMVPDLPGGTLLDMRAFALAAVLVKNLGICAESGKAALAIAGLGIPDLVRRARADLGALTLAAGLVKDLGGVAVQNSRAATGADLKVEDLVARALLGNTLGDALAEFVVVDKIGSAARGGSGALALAVVMVEDLGGLAGSRAVAHAFSLNRVPHFGCGAGGRDPDHALALFLVPHAVDAAVARGAVDRRTVGLTDLLLVGDAGAGIVVDGLGAQTLGEGTALTLAGAVIQSLFGVTFGGIFAAPAEDGG
jgi:hypothetical protein